MLKIEYRGQTYIWHGEKTGQCREFFLDGDGFKGGFKLDSPEWFAAEHIMSNGSIEAARESMKEREAFKLEVCKDEKEAKYFTDALAALDEFSIRSEA